MAIAGSVWLLLNLLLAQTVTSDAGYTLLSELQDWFPAREARGKNTLLSSSVV